MKKAVRLSLFWLGIIFLIAANTEINGTFYIGVLLIGGVIIYDIISWEQQKSDKGNKK
jgi:hypothetical protein